MAPQRVRLADVSLTQGSLPDADIDHFEGSRITRIIKEVVRHYRVPVAFLAMESRSILKLQARHGVVVRTAPLSSVARHKINRDLPIVIESIGADSDYAEDPLVVGPPRMQFFAGAPLITSSHSVVGNLVIMDVEPRVGFSLSDCSMLISSAKNIMAMYYAVAATTDFWKLPVPSMDCLPSSSPSSAPPRSSIGTVQTLESLPSHVIEQLDNTRAQDIIRGLVDYYDMPVAFVAMESPACLKLRVRHGIGLKTAPLTSVARHSVNRELPIIIGDTEWLPGLAEDEVVRGPPKMRFFAGAPLMATPLVCVGTLVIMDDRPRQDFGLHDCTQLIGAAKALMDMRNEMAGASDLWTMKIPSMAVLSHDLSPCVSTPKTQTSVPDVTVELFGTARIQSVVQEVAVYYGVSTAFLAIESPGCLKIRAAHGLEARTLPLTSIARHSVSRDLPIIIEDAFKDGDFSEDPLVVGPPARRFYVGAPLMRTSTQCVGNFVIMGAEPREGVTLSDCDFLVASARSITSIFRDTVDGSCRMYLSVNSLPGLDEECAEFFRSATRESLDSDEGIEPMEGRFSMDRRQSLKSVDELAPCDI